MNVVAENNNNLMTIIQGIIITEMRKTIKGMTTKEMSVGMTTIVVEYFQVEDDTSGIGRTCYGNLSNAICV